MFIKILTGLWASQVHQLFKATEQISCHLSLYVSAPRVPDLPGIQRYAAVLDDFPPSLYGQINRSM